MRSNLNYYLRGAPDGLPIPSLGHIALVTGQPEVDLFFRTGRSAAESIRESLAKHELKVEDFHSILDFGCGCGRVVRYWRDLRSTKIYGVDYNKDLIRWSRKHLPFVVFKTNALQPSLDFPNESFDFIYALSVFTHFTEELQITWMTELTRVLRAEGILLITTHGEYYLDQLNESEKVQFLSGQLVVKGNGQAGSNWLGAYHPKEYIVSKLMNGLDLLSFFPQGAKGNPFQDMYLLKKI